MPRVVLIWLALIVAFAPARASERPFIILPHAAPLTAEQKSALHLIEQDPHTLAVEIIRFKTDAPQEALKRDDILPLGGALYALVSRANAAPPPLPPVGDGIDASEDVFLDMLSEEQAAADLEFLQSERAAAAEASARCQTAGILCHIISRSLTWGDDARITVAFDGGSTAIHRTVAKLALEWESKGDLSFDFGYDPQTKSYRRWREKKPSNAQIRIAISDTGSVFDSKLGKLSSCAARSDAPFELVLVSWTGRQRS